MPRIANPLFAFNRGEVSKLALARIDIAKLRLASDCQLNWEPTVLGAMALRRGLQYLGNVANNGGGSSVTAMAAGIGGSLPATLAVKMVPFVFSTSDTALLELTDGLMRVWVNDTLISRVSVSTAVTNGNFSVGTGWDLASGTTAGCTASIIPGLLQLQTLPLGGVAQARQTITVSGADQNKEHALRFNVVRGPITIRAGSSIGTDNYIPQTQLDAGWHSLSFTPTGNIVLQIETSGDARLKLLASVTIESAGTFTLPTPWTASDLGNIRTSQSGDVVFVACYGKQQYKIERRSLTSWSAAVYQSDTGPFGSQRPISARLQISVYNGIGTIDSDRPYFTTDHIGALYRMFQTGQFYSTTLGANNVYTPAIRVTGVGSGARGFQWTVGGTWTGTLHLQRSFDGPDYGFVDVTSTTSNGTTTTTDTADNVIVWYRIGFKGGNYGSGVAAVIFNYTGGGAAGIARCIGFNSTTQIQIETLTPFSSVNATEDWLESDWSPFRGWPSSVQFFEGRLWWAGRDRQWASEPDNYYGFAQEELDNTSMGDAGAMIMAFGSGPVDSVNWLLSVTRLLSGREGSIASARASSFDQVLTPTNFSVKDCSPQGAARLPALAIGKRGIFVQQSGRRVYELAFSPQSADYEGHDLTRLNTEIGKVGFTDLGIAIQPDQTAYLVRGDGQSACLLYDPEDEVEAWWRVQTLGVIENICVLPSASLEDNVYFVVKRVINGQTIRTVEKMAKRDQCVGGSANRQLDSFTVFTGPTGTITLSHLPSTLVHVWADGAYIGSGTTNGSGVLTPLPGGGTHTSIVAGLGGVIVTGSTNPLTYDNAAPDVLFASTQGTLTVGTQYNGFPAEVFADVGGTGKLERIGPLTVSGGVVTLPNNAVASTIVAMLGYVAPFQSAKISVAAEGGAGLGAIKEVGGISLMLSDTHYQGLKFGQRMDSLDPLPLIEAGMATPDNTIWSRYDAPKITLAGDWQTDARLCLLAQAPRPATVVGAVIDVAGNAG